MNRAHLLACINAAELAGFTHYAAALLALYRSLPDERPEKDGKQNRSPETFAQPVDSLSKSAEHEKPI